MGSSARVWCSVSASEPEILQVAAGAVGALTRGHNEPNQDAMLVVEHSDGSLLLGVADGAGGIAGGREASNSAAGAFVEAIRAAPDALGAMFDAFEAANEAVRSLGRGASTLAVAHINAEAVRTFHAGDSQCAVFGGRGKVKLQTIPHTPLGFAVEAGVIPTRALQQQRHLVSNILGDSPLRVETTTGMPLAKRDTVLVGSDGIFDNLSMQQIAEYARARPLRRATEILFTAVTAQMASAAPTAKPDDLSLLMFRRDS